MPSSMTKTIALPSVPFVSIEIDIGSWLVIVSWVPTSTDNSRPAAVLGTHVFPMAICGKCSDPAAIGRIKELNRWTPGSVFAEISRGSSNVPSLT